MLVLSKRYTNRWQAQASYVLSKAEGNVDNTAGQQIGSSIFENPNRSIVNTDGRLTNDRTHEFKLLGSYSIPKIEVSVNAVLPVPERPELHAVRAVRDEPAERADGVTAAVPRAARQPAPAGGQQPRPQVREDLQPRIEGPDRPVPRGAQHVQREHDDGRRHSRAEHDHHLRARPDYDGELRVAADPRRRAADPARGEVDLLGRDTEVRRCGDTQ